MKIKLSLVALAVALLAATFAPAQAASMAAINAFQATCTSSESDPRFITASTSIAGTSTRSRAAGSS